MNETNLKIHYSQLVRFSVMKIHLLVVKDGENHELIIIMQKLYSSRFISNFC